MLNLISQASNLLLQVTS